MLTRNFTIALISITALTAGIFMAQMLNKPATVLTALLLPSRAPLPPLSLLDQHGNAVTAATFRGQWDLVFFGFTNCPDICPTTLQVLATAKHQLEQAGATPPRIVLVSVDPERDTPEQLGQYVAHFGDGNLGVTGELENIQVLTSALGIYFEKHELGDGDYSVDHSASVLLFNTAGELHALFSGPHVVTNYVHDLPIIMVGK